MEAVCAIVRDQGGRPLSVREGEIQVEGVAVKMFRVLFDTGALHKSYVSAELVEKFRDSWKESIFPHRAVACLADQTTRVETKEVIRGVLSFMADDGVTEYEGLVEAIVWNMPGLD